MNLTKTQLEAISSNNQGIIINANAGTGKTSVLIQRILYLIHKQNIPLENIVAITFTDKAAEELKTRLREELTKLGQFNIENSYISTIHAFCARILREQCFEAGLNPHFNILSNSTEQEVLLEESAEEVLESWLDQDNAQIINLLETYKTKDLITEACALLEKLRSAGFNLADLQELKPTEKIWDNLVKALSELKPTIFTNLKLNLANLLNYAVDLPENFNNYLTELSVILKKEYFENIFIELAEWLKKKPRKPNGYESERFEQFATEFKKAKENFEETQEILAFDRLQENKYLELYADILDFTQAVYQKYSQNKTQANQLDFEDLLLAAKKLLQENSQVRDFYKNKFKQILLDEFQDTNQLQWDIFQLFSSPKNLFIVGDWKQSIYRFRNANVYIFLDLIRKFSTQGHKNIALQENFRSGEPILDLTNFAAQYIWPPEKYTYHKLIYAANKTSRPPVEPKIKINFIPNSIETKKEQKRELEALVLVKEIQSLTQSGQNYRDMAILLRATSDLDIYEQTLQRYGIPFMTFGGRYYYQRQEIIDLINYVKILNNPLLDLTLTGVLRSPLIGIRDESLLILCQLRDNQQKKYIFNVLTEHNIKNSVLIEPDKQKLLNFLKLYNFLTENIGKLPLHSLLHELTEKSNYLLYLLTQANGEQKTANVRKLIDISRTLSDTTISLGRFVRYLDKMQAKEAREEEAATLSTEDNLVKIMTVHKAKGLEFPIVFLPDINRDPGHNSLVFSFDFNLFEKYHLPFGLAFQEESGDKFSSHLHKLHKFLDGQEEIEESKRLFYVALTRAKEKLFVSVILETGLNESVFHTSGNWGKWLSCLYLHKKKELSALAEINIAASQINLLPVEKTKEPESFISDLNNKYKLLLHKTKETLTYSTLSATELAETSHGRDHFLEKYYFEFPQNPEQRSAFNKKISEYIGNTVHYYICNNLKTFEQNSPPKQKEYIQKCLDNYFNSQLAQQKEKYFEIDFDFSSENIYITGRMDLLYKENNIWHIVDFKTNQKTKENLQEYQIQLSVYAEALAKLLKIEIAEIKLTIYYLPENELVEVQPLKDVIKACLKELQ